MLRASLRLSREGFKNTSEARRIHTKNFSITRKVGVPSGLGGSAVIVSKKIARTSVERHALKRKIKNAIQHISSREQVLIVTATTHSSTLSVEEIKKEIQATF